MDIEIFLDLFEMIIIICLGVSCPLSVRRAIVSRTAKGKSLAVDLLLFIACLAAVLRKLIEIEVFEAGGFVFYFGLLIYSICLVLIIIDIVLYCRNKKIDKRRENGENL